MTVTISEAVKAAIMQSDILTNHPAPPEPALYFNAITVRKNRDTGLMEFVMLRDDAEVGFMAAYTTVNFDAGETVTLGRFAGYMPVSITA